MHTLWQSTSKLISRNPRRRNHYSTTNSTTWNTIPTNNQPTDTRKRHTKCGFTTYNQLHYIRQKHTKHRRYSYSNKPQNTTNWRRNPATKSDIYPTRNTKTTKVKESLKKRPQRSSKPSTNSESIMIPTLPPSFGCRPTK